MGRPGPGSIAVLLLVFMSGAAFAGSGGWPTWRGDAQRSGVTRMALPEKLMLRWTVQYPAPRPAWEDARLQFDAAFHPAVSGKTVVFGSSHNDAVVALDTESGGERWRFFTQGPVRVPPFIEQDSVFVASDDGGLYCLDLASGQLKWRFDGAPDRSKVLGNERLISRWPARGGPVVDQGVVYFTAGIWPFMGVFVYAVDAATGRLLWHNDRPSSDYNEPAGVTAATFGSVSPQGALVINGTRLAVPSGRAWPAWFERSTGVMEPYSAGIKDTAGGGDVRIASMGNWLLMGGCVFSLAEQRVLLLNASAPVVTPYTCLPVLDGQTLYVSHPETIEAFDLSSARVSKLAGAYGRPLARCDAASLWKVPVAGPVKVLVKAGSRLYSAGAGWVKAIEEAKADRPAAAVWEEKLEGTAESLAAADGKLFVATREGKLVCFGAAGGGAQSFDRRPPRPAKAVRDGGAVPGIVCVLGGNEACVREMLQNSEHQVVVLERDRERSERLRRVLDGDGQYGERVAVLEGDGSLLPPYLASLVVCPDLKAAGFASGEACVARLFEALRPYGGCLRLPYDPQMHEELIQRVEGSAKFSHAQVKAAGPFTLVLREGALSGAADWTHEAANPGNTWMGKDQRVKAPLGMLWFGGPGEDADLFMQRHANPPTARVCQGRMFVHGDGRITALDAYTGRLLWSRELPKVRAYQNLRSNVEAGPPFEKLGDMTKRASLVAHPDGLYLAYGQAISVWDPATGETRAQHPIPARMGGDGAEPLFLGDLWQDGEVLVAGAGFPTEEEEAVFVAEDFAKITRDRLEEIAGYVALWAGPGNSKPGGMAPLVLQSNQLLHDSQLAERIPAELRQEAERDETRKMAVQKALADIRRYRSVQKETYAPYLRIEPCNRRLIEACFPEIRKLPAKIHWDNLYPWDGTGTRELVGLDRKSGRVLWRRQARYSFPQKAVALGRGRVFCLDRTDPARDDVLRRRGLAPASEPLLLALDLHSGRVCWSQEENISGCDLFYSEEHDVLVQATPHDPAPELWWGKPRDLSIRFLAYRGQDGQVLWDRTFGLNRPGGGHRMWYSWLLQNDRLLVESYRDGVPEEHAEFYGLRLLTGEEVSRKSPVTDQPLPWGFRRMRGCTKNVSCPNLVLFRSQTGGYYDIAADGGTANLSGFRPGCKNSLIPADGLLCAPNYASGCTCNYSVFTSLALTHMPEVETWATNSYPFDGARVRRLGLNLGAPGDRRADSGTLWLDFPSVGGPSPDVPVRVKPEGVRWFYRHSARSPSSAVPGWIIGSGGEGIESLEIDLCGKEAAPAAMREEAVTYTVRLYFAEPEPIGPGQRVFSVWVQDREVVRDLDIVKEAGAPGRGWIRDCRGVPAQSQMAIRLVPKTGTPLLCGVELVKEDGRPEGETADN